MGTNPDKGGDDDSAPVTAEDLKRDKYGQDGVETSEEEDETDEATDESEEEDSTETEGEDEDQGSDEDSQDEDSEDDSQDDSDDEDSDTFVKKFEHIKGDTLPDYARNLEKAYDNSTSEAIRLKRELDELKAKGASSIKGDTGVEGSDDESKDKGPQDPLQMYMKGKMEQEVVEAFDTFAKDYPQVDDAKEYEKFTHTVEQLGSTIMNSENRMASPRELYSKAAVILGWTPKEKQPNPKEKVGMAVKDRAAVSKGATGPKKPAAKSKVTQKMIELNRKMYPGKSDAEIRKELEPYVQ